MKSFNIVKQLLLYVITAASILLITTYDGQQILGHNFAGDESASFLALMDQLQTEMNLIYANLMDTNNNGNKLEIAKDHLNKINELYTDKIKKEIAERNERNANEISSSIDEIYTIIKTGNSNNAENDQNIQETVNIFKDIIGEAISSRINPDVLNNATVQALHFADLINWIDVSYANALGTKPMNMSGMNISGMNVKESRSISGGNNSNIISLSSSLSMNMNREDSSSSNSMANRTQNITNTSNAMNASTSISNLASYQTTKELTNVAMILYNSSIKLNIPSNAIDNANAIEFGLQQVKDMIDSKAPYNKVMRVIHGPIQTNVQEAFNLPLKTSK